LPNISPGAGGVSIRTWRPISATTLPRVTVPSAAVCSTTSPTAGPSDSAPSGAAGAAVAFAGGAGGAGGAGAAGAGAGPGSSSFVSKYDGSYFPPVETIACQAP